MGLPKCWNCKEQQTRQGLCARCEKAANNRLKLRQNYTFSSFPGPLDEFTALVVEALPGLYFLRGPWGDLVKVGWASTSVLQRLQGHRTSLPCAVVLAAKYTTDHPLERQFHRKLAESRVTGEWFRTDPLVLETIRGLRGMVPKV